MKKGERETVEKDERPIKATEKENIPSLKAKEEGILLKKSQFHKSFSGNAGNKFSVKSLQNLLEISF